MHEMSLAENVLQIIEDAGRDQGFSRVKTVVLEIGRLASVEIEALRFCFDVVMQGSMAEGALLEIVEVCAEGLCLHCAAEMPMSEQYAACPNCGSHRVQVTSGTDMRVKELEVE